MSGLIFGSILHKTHTTAIATAPCQLARQIASLQADTPDHKVLFISALLRLIELGDNSLELIELVRTELRFTAEVSHERRKRSAEGLVHKVANDARHQIWSRGAWRIEMNGAAVVTDDVSLLPKSVEHSKHGSPRPVPSLPEVVCDFPRSNRMVLGNELKNLPLCRAKKSLPVHAASCRCL